MLTNRTSKSTFHVGIAWGSLTCGVLALCTIDIACGPCLQTEDGNCNTSSGAGGEGTGGNSTGGNGTGGNGTGGAATGGGGSGGGNPDMGWTEFKESPDTLKIHVSNSDGDDANDGSTPEKAVKTLAKGKSLLRDGQPDWMLLKRGDIWNEALGTWQKSGRSATERMLVSSYGNAAARPLIKTGKDTALSALSGNLSHIAFVGMHFYAHTRDPDSAEFTGLQGSEGVRWLTTTDDLLFEDVMVQYYAGTNLTIQGNISNFKLRRSIIADSYNASATSHSNGIYLQDVKGILIEENLFDHNGWNTNAKLAGMGTGPTIFNHNAYIQVTCQDLTFRGNITTRASSHGFQARPGGIVDDNLIIDNPIGFSFGLVEGGSNPKPGGVTGHVGGNVVRDAGDITAALPRGIGAQIGNIQSATIENNIFAHDKSAESYGVTIELGRKQNPQVPDEQIQNLTIRKNVLYDWRGGIRFSTGALTAVVIEENDVQSPLRASTLAYYFNMGFDAGTSYAMNHWFSIEAVGSWFLINTTPQSFAQWQMTSGEKGATNTALMYVDPERKISTYHESLGQPGTFDAFLAEARKQTRLNYRHEYTAQGPIAYIRAGFVKK